MSPIKERVRFGRQEWLMEEARIQRPVERWVGWKGWGCGA